MVLEPKTKCFMRKFARIGLLHIRLCLPALFLTGACCTGCSLASCRCRLRVSRLRSSGSVGKRVRTKSVSALPSECTIPAIRSEIHAIEWLFQTTGSLGIGSSNAIVGAEVSDIELPSPRFEFVPAADRFSDRRSYGRAFPGIFCFGKRSAATYAVAPRSPYMENYIHSGGAFQRYYSTTKAEISSEPVRCLEAITDKSDSYLLFFIIYRQATFDIFLYSESA